MYTLTLSIHVFIYKYVHTFSTQSHSCLYPRGNISPRTPNVRANASKPSTWRREHPSPVSVARNNLQATSTDSDISLPPPRSTCRDTNCGS